MALTLPGNGRHAESLQAERASLLKMEFTTFRRAFIAIPAQVVKTSRKIVLRFLAWNRWLPAFFRLLDQLRMPLRC